MKPSKCYYWGDSSGNDLTDCVMSRICSCFLLSSIYYLNQEAFVQAVWKTFCFKNLAMQNTAEGTEFIKCGPCSHRCNLVVFIKKKTLKSLLFDVVCLCHCYCHRALGSDFKPFLGKLGSTWNFHSGIPLEFSRMGWWRVGRILMLGWVSVPGQLWSAPMCWFLLITC